MKTMYWAAGAMALSVAAAQAAPVPQFKDYPIAVYSGRTATLHPSEGNDADMRAALQQPADFGGEYVTVMQSCGGGCRLYSFISKRSGKVARAHFGGEDNHEDVVDTRANSRLLITQQEHVGADYRVKSRTVRFYVMLDGQLRLLQSMEAPPEH